ncbi:hypothetical protein TPAU25S_00947 [Tsukamurella paurometabola]
MPEDGGRLIDGTPGAGCVVLGRRSRTAPAVLRGPVRVVTTIVRLRLRLAGTLARGRTARGRDRPGTPVRRSLGGAARDRGRTVLAGGAAVFGVLPGVLGGANPGLVRAGILGGVFRRSARTGLIGGAAVFGVRPGVLGVPALGPLRTTGAFGPGARHRARTGALGGVTVGQVRPSCLGSGVRCRVRTGVLGGVIIGEARPSCLGGGVCRRARTGLVGGAVSGGGRTGRTGVLGGAVRPRGGVPASSASPASSGVVPASVSVPESSGAPPPEVPVPGVLGGVRRLRGSRSGVGVALAAVGVPSGLALQVLVRLGRADPRGDGLTQPALTPLRRATLAHGRRAALTGRRAALAPGRRAALALRRSPALALRGRRVGHRQHPGGRVRGAAGFGGGGVPRHRRSGIPLPGTGPALPDVGSADDSRCFDLSGDSPATDASSMRRTPRVRHPNRVPPARDNAPWRCPNHVPVSCVRAYPTW